MKIIIREDYRIKEGFRGQNNSIGIMAVRKMSAMNAMGKVTIHGNVLQR